LAAVVSVVVGLEVLEAAFPGAGAPAVVGKETEMTPEELTKELQKAIEGNLKSVVLYGSAAAGDYRAKKSDYNILVVMEWLGVEDLMGLAKISNRWAKWGNPPPLLFTLAQLKVSADVFPIEFSDIKDSRRILYGEDPFAEIVINPAHIRHELEHELKGKLIQFREQFLLTEGKPRHVRELLIKSSSTFLVLFRAVLRLYGGNPSAKKLEALAELRKHIEFDEDVFHRFEDKTLDPLVLFARTLKAVETVVDVVDAYSSGEKNEK
jgi:hypothetical protein